MSTFAFGTAESPNPVLSIVAATTRTRTAVSRTRMRITMLRLRTRMSVRVWQTINRSHGKGGRVLTAAPRGASHGKSTHQGGKPEHQVSGGVW
ncbi:hypothetical protein [Hoylesella shahii]|uniref:hypothetical protein n=1 Tax=Hoylesella shahii TaxID=228603 RepID=UPI0011B78219|nr:hypothetical protein [Hoylesella shahii]